MKDAMHRKVIPRNMNGEFLPRWEEMDNPTLQKHTHDCIYCHNRVLCGDRFCGIQGPVVCPNCAINTKFLCLDCRKESKLIKGKLFPSHTKMGRCPKCLEKYKKKKQEIKFRRSK